MITEEPPFIEVGADVSAKFKGAFCEATVKSAKKLVKCKILLKNGTSCVVNDDHIEGPLKLNALVKVKQQDNDFQEGNVVKLTDNSLYTVVFDDGDEKTLRRTSLCLKGERHFQEDETLDNRPLNNPENFGAPVPRQRAEKTRKRTRLLSQNSLEEEEMEEEAAIAAKKKRGASFGKVICVELGERRKSWFPALCLPKNMAESLLVEKNQMVVQSFKDGKRISVSKSDVKEFSKDKEPLLSFMRGDTKIDPILRAAIDKALMFHDHGELPRGWQVDLADSNDSSSSSEEETTEKDEQPSQIEQIFLDKLHKLMEEQGTPISKPPLLGCKEVDLYKLYHMVMKNGGMEEVSNLSKWRSIYVDLGLTNPPTTASYNIRNIYKRYLYPYEEVERGLEGSDRKPSETEKEKNTIKEKEKSKKSGSDSENENNSRRLTRMQSKNESDSEIEKRETRSSRPRRHSVEKTFHSVQQNRPNASSTESSDESTASSTDADFMSKREDNDCDSDHNKNSEGDELVDILNSPQSSVVSEEKDFSDTRSEGEMTLAEDGRYPIGARVLVKYGKAKSHRAYEAKVIDVDAELTPDLVYYVHYRGWNHRYDEWIKHDIITGLSPTPCKKKNGGAKNSPVNLKYRHDTPPGAHSVPINIPSSVSRQTSRSKPRRNSPPPLQLAMPLTPPTEKPIKTASTTSKAVQSISKSSNTPQKPAVAPAKPAATATKPAATAAKPAATAAKPAATATKPAATATKPASTPVKPASTPVKPASTPVKPAAITAKPVATSPKPPTPQPKPTITQPKPSNPPPKPINPPPKPSNPPPKPCNPPPKPAIVQKTNYTSTKIEPPFSDVKVHPVKPRTTRNSMQDVFLITALEESISVKGSNGRRKGSPSRGPDSPSNENTVGQRSRRARDKQNYSPIPEEEQSDSSSAKEDDVEMPEQNRTPQHKKANRRKRKERSPFVKEESKESADDDSANDYSIPTWREKNKSSEKTDIKSKNSDQRKEKSRSSRAKSSNSKDKNMEEISERDAEENNARKSLEMSSFIDHNEESEDMKEIRQAESPLKDIADSNDETPVEKKDRVVKKRKNESKNSQDRILVKFEDDDSYMEDKGEDFFAKTTDFLEHEESNIEDNLLLAGNKQIKTENNNMDDIVTTKLPNAEEIISMERAVDILQQAAAINAEKEKIFENSGTKMEAMLSPAQIGHMTPDKRRKRKERKRRRRAPSCTVDPSESENSLQSPIKMNRDYVNQSCPLDSEKFDFVSDLDELARLEASERIRVIQGRIYDIQKLYGKLKTELASIERRKRRKLRKQCETVSLAKSIDCAEAKHTITRL